MSARETTHQSCMQLATFPSCITLPSKSLYSSIYRRFGTMLWRPHSMWKLDTYDMDSGSRNHLSEEIYSTCNWQKDAFRFYCIYWFGLLEKSVCLVETNINQYRHKEDVCNALMVWYNTYLIFKEQAYVANWLSCERCIRPLNEPLIWYSWVIRIYTNLYGLDISIKASRRYHGSHQKHIYIYWWSTIWSGQFHANTRITNRWAY